MLCKEEKMTHINRKYLFRFIRFCFRCFNPSYSVRRLHNEAAPAAYVVHHQNLKGPVISMAWFDRLIHPWGLSVFFNHSACYRHYYNYTFTKRFGMPSVLAAILAFPLSFFISALMVSMEGIPVFRGSKDIVKTFKESMSVLNRGESLLICPDVDYANEGNSMGEMYMGFLNLERIYIKQTGKHLMFVPLHIDNKKHCINVGQGISFNSDGEFKQERLRVYNKLKEEFARLEKQDDMIDS